ncbi:M20/M25/M40 family metallo-hydrolase [Mucisphaera sp.]|uniref:M20/M25/M40 family metallo-hydrolase n=1 Tax=Mucisphaera sp. TaxID=2913024 RepID=UPI003D151E6D
MTQLEGTSLRTRGKHPAPFEIDLLKEILAQPTSPFHEQNVATIACDTACDIGWDARADHVGNLLITPTPDTQPELILTAHMDHPGFWALETPSPGRLLAQWMGRVPGEAMIDQPVRFWTSGQAITRLPGDWSNPDTSARLGGVTVDGYVRNLIDSNELDNPSLVEIEIEGEVAPGSIGMWRLDEPRVRDGIIYARAIDDLAAVAALLIVAQRLSAANEKTNLGILLTRAEEGGFFGAIDYCRNFTNPKDAPLHVGLEMSMARGDVAVGTGVVLRVGDRRTTFNPAVTDWENRVASTLDQSDPDFGYQRQLMPGGSCESTIFEAFFGRAGALCLPLGNYHNVTEDGQIAPEYIDLSDFRDLVELCIALARTPFGGQSELPAFAARWSEYADRHQHLYTESHAFADPQRQVVEPSNADIRGTA